MQRHRMEHLNTSETTNRKLSESVLLGIFKCTGIHFNSKRLLCTCFVFFIWPWFWEVFVTSTCYGIQIYMYYLFYQKGIKEIKEINILQQNLMKSKPVIVKNHFKNLIAFYPICVIFFKEKYNQQNFFFQIECLWL